MKHSAAVGHPEAAYRPYYLRVLLTGRAGQESRPAAPCAPSRTLRPVLLFMLVLATGCGAAPRHGWTYGWTWSDGQSNQDIDADVVGIGKDVIQVSTYYPNPDGPASEVFTLQRNHDGSYTHVCPDKKGGAPYVYTATWSSSDELRAVSPRGATFWVRRKAPVREDPDKNFLEVYGLIVILILGIWFFFILPAKVEQDAKEQRKKDEQKEWYNQIVALVNQSSNLFESLPLNLDYAERWLDSAEVNFADRAFAPFWDSIENAAKCLALFNQGVQGIHNNLTCYTAQREKCGETPPRFPVAPHCVAKLRVATATSERMQAIVRKGQRDFEFASIYEQRRTNQILIAGFNSLAQALSEMTSQLTSSIDTLCGSVDTLTGAVGELTSTVDDSSRKVQSGVAAVAEAAIQLHRDGVREAADRAAREGKALEMLDNIQHRRRPIS